jgi:hypothetical protein
MMVFPREIVRRSDHVGRSRVVFLLMGNLKDCPPEPTGFTSCGGRIWSSRRSIDLRWLDISPARDNATSPRCSHAIPDAKQPTSPHRDIARAHIEFLRRSGLG